MKDLFYKLMNFIMEPCYYVYWNAIVAWIAAQD